MLDFDRIRPAAKVAFEKQLREKVEWLSTRCWATNLRSSFEELNEIIEAGINLGVSGNCRQLTEQEMVGLVTAIKPLRTLKMETEVREILIIALNNAGVDPNIFNK